MFWLFLVFALSLGYVFIVRKRKVLGREVGGYLFFVFVFVEVELGWVLWFIVFQQGYCYEFFVKYGNFSSSVFFYFVGIIVEFSCDFGYILEQGFIIIECVDFYDFQWNEIESVCRGQQVLVDGFVRGRKQGGYQGVSSRVWGYRGFVIFVIRVFFEEEVGVFSNGQVLLWVGGSFRIWYWGERRWDAFFGFVYFLVVCSGEIIDSVGVVFFFNWLEFYGRGQDCIWGVYVEEDKRIMLDVRV